MSQTYESSPPELLHDPRQVAALDPSGGVGGLPVVEALDDLGQILAEDELGHADVVAVVAQDGEELHHAQGVAALLEKGPEIRTLLADILLFAHALLYIFKTPNVQTQTFDIECIA